MITKTVRITKQKKTLRTPNSLQMMEIIYNIIKEHKDLIIIKVDYMKIILTERI